MDNRVKSIEHRAGVFPWPGHEEDPEQQTEPDDKLLAIFPPVGKKVSTAVYQETMMMHTTLTDLSTAIKQMKMN